MLFLGMTAIMKTKSVGTVEIELLTDNSTMEPFYVIQVPHITLSSMLGRTYYYNQYTQNRIRFYWQTVSDERSNYTQSGSGLCVNRTHRLAVNKP